MKVILVLFAITLSVFLIACNGDDDSSSTAASATPVVSDGSPTMSPDTDAGTPIPDAGSTDSFAFPASPDPATEPSLLTDVRVGAHPEGGGYDRIVFEFDGVRPSGLVGYQDEVSQCGSGQAVHPQGSAILKVHLDFTNAHTEAGELSIPSTTVNGPGNSILQSIGICDFEAVVEWAVGTDGKKPFTVTLLDNPSRVVIDVAH
jgi:hypothetical protein